MRSLVISKCISMYIGYLLYVDFVQLFRLKNTTTFLESMTNEFLVFVHVSFSILKQYPCPSDFAIITAFI